MYFHGVDIGYNEDDVLFLGVIDNRFIADALFEAIIKLCKENGFTFRTQKTLLAHDKIFGKYLRTKDNMFHGYRIEMPKKDYDKLMALIGDEEYKRLRK
jgi:hypothetical protein